MATEIDKRIHFELDLNVNLVEIHSPLKRCILGLPGDKWRTCLQ